MKIGVIATGIWGSIHREIAPPVVDGSERQHIADELAVSAVAKQLATLYEGPRK